MPCHRAPSPLPQPPWVCTSVAVWTPCVQPPPSPSLNTRLGVDAAAAGCRCHQTACTRAGRWPHAGRTARAAAAHDNVRGRETRPAGQRSPHQTAGYTRYCTHTAGSASAAPALPTSLGTLRPLASTVPPSATRGFCPAHRAPSGGEGEKARGGWGAANSGGVPAPAPASATLLALPHNRHRGNHRHRGLHFDAHIARET